MAQPCQRNNRLSIGLLTDSACFMGQSPDCKEHAPEAFVFGTETGEPMKRRQAHKLWESTCRRAHICGLNFHDLRAEHGSQPLEAGVDLKKVSETLGHSNVIMTDAYLRSRIGAMAAAYEKLEAARAAKVVDIHRGRRRSA